jgi:HNH endonuclease
VVWAGICALSEASQHDVWKELGARLAFPAEREGGPHAIKVAKAVAALREASNFLGRSPSVSEYRHLKREGDHDWPPDGSVRRWLGGSWNDALSRAHLDAVPEDLELIVEGAHAYTREEAIAAMKACQDELGKTPTFNNYLNWARRSDVRKRPGRRPASQNVFERLFGGYIEALKAAGMAREDGTGAPLSTLQRSGKNYRWSDEDLMRAISEVIEFVGEDRFPTCGEYARVREQILECEREQGPVTRAIPSMNGFQRRFGGWRKTAEFHERWRSAQEQEASACD